MRFSKVVAILAVTLFACEGRLLAAPTTEAELMPYLQKAAALGRGGKVGEGLGLVEKVLKRKADMTPARILRARLLIKLDRGSEAVADLQALKKLNPGSKEIADLLAKAEAPTTIVLKGSTPVSAPDPVASASTAQTSPSAAPPSPDAPPSGDSVVNVDFSTSDATLESHAVNGATTFVMVTSPGCGTCRITKPKLDALAASRPTARVVYADVGLNEKGRINFQAPVMKRYDIHATPWFMVVGPDGTVTFKGRGDEPKLWEQLGFEIH